MTEVTVLIASYNPGSYLCDALESVFRQTTSDWRIVLVDDASTDNSLKLAAKYLNDSRVQVIRNSTNIGQSKSLNKGLSHVNTPFVVQLDSDDEFVPTTIEVLLDAAKHHPEDVVVFGGQLATWAEESPEKTFEISRRRSFEDKYDFLRSGQNIVPRFYRMHALKSVGGWPVDDPYEGRYMEDKRVLLRLIENYRFHSVDEVLYRHRLHATQQTNLDEVYSKILDWTVRDALKRWGNKYEPVFRTVRGLNKELTGLKPRQQSKLRNVKINRRNAPKAPQKSKPAGLHERNKTTPQRADRQATRPTLFNVKGMGSAFRDRRRATRHR